MLKLNIRQQPAKVDLHITYPTAALNIRQPQIQLDTEPVVVEIRRTEGKLSVDSYPSRYCYGHRTAGDSVKEFAQKSRQLGNEGIGRIVAEGHRLGAIETGETDVIAHIAAENMLEEMPAVILTKVKRPEIDYQPGELDFNTRRGEVDLTLARGTVGVNLQRGRVTGTVAQYPDVRLWTTEGKYDKLV